MNTRKLADHYEINKHYLTQDIKNALALIVDNIDMLSDDQIKQLRVAMDETVLRRWANRCDEDYM